MAAAIQQRPDNGWRYDGAIAAHRHNGVAADGVKWRRTVAQCRCPNNGGGGTVAQQAVADRKRRQRI
ncbi:hypothetical protein E2562_016502, partial [Oryza meyeriana var. granulata]